MSLLVCEDCTTRYPPGVEQCPHCGSGEAVAEEVVEQQRPLLAVRVVACVNTACPARGTQRRVPLRHAGPGVFELPGLVCARCQHAMADVKASEEDSVAKISVHGGPTDANADSPNEAGADEATDLELAAGEDTDPDGDGQGYEAWNVEQLKAELATRDLPTTGKKAELQQRLVESDNEPVSETS